LQLDDEGIALRGLIIRHLVLPGGRAGSRETLAWIAQHLGTETHIALMNQYFPAHLAVSSDEIGRKIEDGEYDEVVAALEELGLEHGWVQE
jgi:putative pyruvate formate lyase activating enzyme